MSWLQLHVVAPRASAGDHEDALIGAGAVSVTLADNADNPILEPGVGETPLWETVRLTALFEADTSREEVERTTGLSARDCQWEVLEDQPWERAWMEHFQPIRCGERLWICPSWQEPPDPNAINLILDPGLAFGSGTHPTTFLCLQWLDAVPLQGKTVLDYGCGSGILGIAALLLGAERVVAVDNDPQALLATRDNLQRNGLEASRLTTCLPDETPPLSADVTIANILAGPLIDLAPRIAGLTAGGGQLCLSGIMSHQADAVSHAYPGFTFSEPVIVEDWVRLNAIKIS